MDCYETDEIRKDTIVWTILRSANHELPDSLDDIADFLYRGGGIGKWAVTSSTVVHPDALHQELVAMGDDGTFFEDDD